MKKILLLVLPLTLSLGLKAQTFFEEQFEDLTLSMGGSHIDSLLADETSCGELRLKNNPANGLIGTFKPVVYTPRVNGAAQTIDMSGNTKITMRVRAESAFDIRIDMKDGSVSTNGSAFGKITQTTTANLDDWEILTFEYPSDAFAENGVDSTSIKTLNIFLDPSNAGFPGALFIDYIAFGDATGSGDATCKSPIEDPAGWEGDGASMHYEEQFNDEVVSLSGQWLTQMVSEETTCGEVSVEMAQDSVLPTFKPILLTPAEPVDMSNNTKIVMRARASSSMKIRIDLKSGSASTNGDNGKIDATIPAGTDEYTELTFFYPAGAFSDTGVDSTAIDVINIFLDPSNEGFPGKLYIDYIAFGEPTGVGNATECVNVGLFDRTEEPQLSVFPNPVSDGRVYFGKSLENIQLIDATGQVWLQTDKAESLDVSSLHNGVYTLRSNDGWTKISINQ